MHGIAPVAILVGSQYHAGKSGYGIYLRVFKVDIDSHLNVFQNQIPCHFPQELRNALIFPTPGTAHVPLAVIAFNRSHE